MSDLMSLIEAYLAEPDRPKRRLRYSSDLDPEACERAIWLSLHGGRKRSPTVAERIRWDGGKRVERIVVDALAKAGRLLETQVIVQPTRPSAWAWGPGHADALVVADGRREVYEVKGVRSAAFRRATDRNGLRDPVALVRDSYRWQLSAYFHELKETHGAEGARMVILDREGENAPQELELVGAGLLIPLDAIIAQETRRAPLALASTPEPPPLQRGRIARVWKTKAPVYVERLPWKCSYCPFRGASCDPGPEAEVVFTACVDHDAFADAVEEGQRRLAAGAATPAEVEMP
jgi:hypothetical protein